ncbi:hypothetical protein [Sorangium sp. So ce1182]|uniref:hypothetical protein n=1 Tax=Sorangium sp. So ce1182 TaxID=3133334 RepID=UPI003F64518D
MPGRRRARSGIRRRRRLGDGELRRRQRCALFTDLGALLEVCGGHDYWSRQAEAFCNDQYPVGGYVEGIIPGPSCDEPSQGVRLYGLECCPNRECCWNGAGFAHTYPAYCPGEAVNWQLCEGQPGVCCDTAGGPTFQPVCGCEPGSVLPQESCSVCCRRGIQLALSRPAACDPAQVVPSSWCAPDSPDLVHLRRCGLTSPCEASFEIGGGDAPWNLCILDFLASGAAGYIEAEDSGDYSRGEYIYVQAPGAALWQRFYESDGDHPPTIPAPPVECVLRPPSYFESCLTSGDPACSRPENWFVSCSDAPITTCP